jgi:VanZ family protein
LDLKTPDASTSLTASRVRRYLPVVLWATVIFFLSTSAGSLSKTSFIVRPVLHFLFPSADEPMLDSYQFAVRKLAHLTEYAVLGVLAARAFLWSSRNGLHRWWFAAAFSVVLAVAAADELNQSFDPLRTGTPVDVLIDLAGGAIGLFLYFAERYVISFWKSGKQ